MNPYNTRGLHQETEDVASNEYLGHPPDPDYGEFLAAYENDEPAQVHVDTCGEKRWRNKEQNALHYIGSERPVRRLGCR